MSSEGVQAFPRGVTRVVERGGECIDKEEGKLRGKRSYVTRVVERGVELIH